MNCATDPEQLTEGKNADIVPGARASVSALVAEKCPGMVDRGQGRIVRRELVVLKAVVLHSEIVSMHVLARQNIGSRLPYHLPVPIDIVTLWRSQRHAIL